MFASADQEAAFAGHDAIMSACSRREAIVSVSAGLDDAITSSSAGKEESASASCKAMEFVSASGEAILSAVAGHKSIAPASAS